MPRTFGGVVARITFGAAGGSTELPFRAPAQRVGQWENGRLHLSLPRLDFVLSRKSHARPRYISASPGGPSGDTRHLGCHRHHLLDAVGGPGHAGDAAHPQHYHPARDLLLPRELSRPPDPQLAARTHLAGPDRGSADHIPARAAPRPRTTRAHGDVAPYPLPQRQRRGYGTDRRRGRSGGGPTRPAAIRRLDDHRAGDRTAGLRGPRRDTGRHAHAPAAHQYLLPKLSPA